MARTMTDTGRPPILPDGAADLLKKYLRQTGGLGVMAVGLFLLGSLIGFTPEDPSFNNATDIATANLMGPAGAYVSDLLLQMLGLAGGLPMFVLFAWGWQIMHRDRVTLVGMRLVMLLSALTLAAIALAPAPHFNGWPLVTGLGGAGGALLFEDLTTFIAPPFAAWTVTVAAAVLGAAAFVLALGLKREEWRRLAYGVWGLLSRTGRLLRTIWHRIGGLTARNQDVDNAIEAELEAGAGPVSKGKRSSKTKRVSAKSPRPKSGHRAQQERQHTLDLGLKDGYAYPPLELLEAPRPAARADAVNKSSLEQNARLLESVLDDFGVRGEILGVRPGPVVTLYELEPAPGTKTSRVIGLADDIARSMSAVSVRVAVVPGRNVIGIELPNARREIVHLRELLASENLERSSGKLNLALGKDIGGAPVLVDLARMPHLLIAGTTGSGKSVAINTMILSLLYQFPPETCKFIMIDPKMLELSVYDGIPHLLSPVVTDPSKAVVALKWAVREMEDRYRLISRLGVRNITGYNTRLAQARKKGEALTRRVQTGFDEAGKPVFEDQPLDMTPLPLIVVVVDEMADLMLVAGKDIEAAVQRLAQMARAAGIHLIMATQRPSVDVITGTIKANFPTRVSFQVTSKIDSRTILGEQGAEQLLGQGDMLYMAGGGRIARVHGPFVSDAEVETVVQHLKQQGAPDYVEAVTEETEGGAPMFLGDPAGAVAGGGNSGDALYDEAVALVTREGKASTSFVQRHLQIGYNRAARIIERMEQESVVSKANRVGRREVLAGSPPE